MANRNLQMATRNFKMATRNISRSPFSDLIANVTRSTDPYHGLPAVTRDLGLHSLIQKIALFGQLLQQARDTEDLF